MQTNLYSLFLPQNFFLLTENISIVFLKEISLYQLSVSADKTKNISVFYRYRTIRNSNLSVIIRIGRYEKKLIGRPLLSMVNKFLMVRETRARNLYEKPIT